MELKLTLYLNSKSPLDQMNWLQQFSAPDWNIIHLLIFVAEVSFPMQIKVLIDIELGFEIPHTDSARRNFACVG